MTNYYPNLRLPGPEITPDQMREHVSRLCRYLASTQPTTDDGYAVSFNGRSRSWRMGPLFAAALVVLNPLAPYKEDELNYLTFINFRMFLN